MYEKPGQLFELDSPDKDELKRVNRNNKINKILK